MKIEFELNGEPVSAEVTPDLMLLHLLREGFGLTGTKNGCESGDCGTCGVLLNGKLTKSCLLPAEKVAGKQVVTIEGLALPGGEPNDLQQAFLRHGAVQCGYCIPAMVLAGEALLRRNGSPNRQEIRKGISPVLCRCTGYQQIVDAIEETAELRRKKIIG